MGESVHAMSEGEGKGASFVVSLPLAPLKNKEERGLVAAEKALERLSLEGVRVLVVDDEPDARELLKRLLKEHHATAVLAGSAEQGLELMRTERFDVIHQRRGDAAEKDGYQFITGG